MTLNQRGTVPFFSSFGFTLIEVVVTLMVVAILGTMLVIFTRSNLSESSMTVLGIRQTYNLSGVMDNITADYKRILSQEDKGLGDFRNAVGSVGEQANAYGSYKVIFNNFITFSCSQNACSESVSEDATNILKITIADIAEQQKITALFAE
jgi:prepilin-type N-terminal cleavage/methylation domain-containing protein